MGIIAAVLMTVWAWCPVNTQHVPVDGAYQFHNGCVMILPVVQKAYHDETIQCEWIEVR